MNETRLTAQTIHTIGNNEANAVIDAEIEKVIDDMLDREDATARKVTLVITFKRRKDGGIETDLQASATLPPKRTCSNTGRPAMVAGSPSLMFAAFPDEQPNLAFEGAAS